MTIATPLFASFGGAIEFIFTPQTSNVTGGSTVGGIDQVIELALAQLEVTVLALALALLIALPAGLFLGHRGKGELVAVGLGNAGRAIPELGLIALMAAVIGVGLFNLTVALAILGIPPILVNTFVGIREVDRSTVEAARGMGMTELEIVRKVEAPMAVTSIFTGIRTATIGIVATATIAPLAGVATLGEFILGENVYGSNGVLAGAIVVAVLALALEFSLAGLQRVLTSKGLKLRPA
jgi:osmoprotectant transport system permease protein